MDTVPDPSSSAKYEMGTQEQLDETVGMVEDLDRRCVAVKADVRDSGQMRGVVDRAVSEYGKIDILCANAGIFTFGAIAGMTDAQWRETIDTNLTGVFNAMRAVNSGERLLIARSSTAKVLLE